MSTRRVTKSVSFKYKVYDETPESYSEYLEKCIEKIDNGESLTKKEQDYINKTSSRAHKSNDYKDASKTKFNRRPKLKEREKIACEFWLLHEFELEKYQTKQKIYDHLGKKYHKGAEAIRSAARTHKEKIWPEIEKLKLTKNS